MKTAIALLVAFAATSAAYGKDKHPKQDNSSQDQITVVAHIPVSGGPITRFIPTQHYGHSYIYAEHESGKTLTVIDLSKPAKPSVLSDVTYPEAAAVGNVLSATGTAALVSDTPNSAAGALPSETIRIMNFSDPLHPTVAQEFKGVTATSREAGLILLANPDGIWVLQQHYGLDPAEDECYAHYVIYGSSQFCPPHP